MYSTVPLVLYKYIVVMVPPTCKSVVPVYENYTPAFVHPCTFCNTILVRSVSRDTVPGLQRSGGRAGGTDRGSDRCFRGISSADASLAVCFQHLAFQAPGTKERVKTFIYKSVTGPAVVKSTVQRWIREKLCNTRARIQIKIEDRPYTHG